MRGKSPHHRTIKDLVYLERVERFLRECIEVADQERDEELARQIRIEIAHLGDRRRFPVTRLRMLAPGQSPERAALELFRRLIHRSIAAQELRK